MPASLIERLKLDAKVVDEMAAGLRDVIQLPDPVGEIVKTWRRPSGLLVGRMRIPIGVIAIIYESRPNVTVDAFSLCLKSGNVVILKGGKEALHSNRALFSLIARRSRRCGAPAQSAQLIETSDREYLYELLGLSDYIDLVIPRGGEALIQERHGAFEGAGAQAQQGRLRNLRGRRGGRGDGPQGVHERESPETGHLQRHGEPFRARGHSPAFLPGMIASLREAGVTVKGCEKTRRIVAGLEEATDADWSRGVPRFDRSR